MSTVLPYNVHDYGRRCEKRGNNTTNRPHHREICMLEYTLGPAAKNTDLSWSDAGDWTLSPHREKLTQLMVDLEGMMYSGTAGSFVAERAEALYASLKRELGD
jgi:hypothetical protein